MDLRSLTYFITVAEATSISKAAKILHISQPPLSVQIKLLEEELGVKLMERGYKNITLTEAGKLFYKRAKDIIRYSESTINEMQHIGKGLGGTIRVGMISSCGPSLLPTILSGFFEEYPDVSFEILEKNTYGLLDALNDNLIEIAFVRTPFDDVSSYKSIEISSEPLVALGTPELLEHRKGSIHLDFFDNKPLILYRRWQKILTSVFASRSIDPKFRCVNDDARTCVSWAKEGLGIAIVPKSMCYDIESDDCYYINIDSKELITKIQAVWRADFEKSPAFYNLIKTLEHSSIKGKGR